jgi:mRNA-degrading endonuclease RelE of RelBE toxin-antitoxin system
MAWEIILTKPFEKIFRKYKKDREFVDAPDKKIERLKEDPEHVGGHLAGRLHGYKSTRIVKKLRLVFKVVSSENKVYLMAIDHRKFDYENFNFE